MSRDDPDECDTMHTCPHCNGAKVVRGWTCWLCHGEGLVTKETRVEYNRTIRDEGGKS